MSDWRIDLIQRSFEAFSGLDAEAAFPVYDADCVWDLGQDIGTVFGQQVFHGHEGLRQLMDKIGEVFPDWTPTIDELRATESGELLLRGGGTGHSRLTGMGLEMTEYAQIITFKDGKILRIEMADVPPPGWDEAKRVG